MNRQWGVNEYLVRSLKVAGFRVLPCGIHGLTQVADLLDPSIGDWDEALVQDIFSEFDAEAILKLRVNQELEDRPAWHYDKKGVFSVRSAYRLV